MKKFLLNTALLALCVLAVLALFCLGMLAAALGYAMGGGP